MRCEYIIYGLPELPFLVLTKRLLIRIQLLIGTRITKRSNRPQPGGYYRRLNRGDFDRIDRQMRYDEKEQNGNDRRQSTIKKYVISFNTNIIISIPHGAHNEWISTWAKKIYILEFKNYVKQGTIINYWNPAVAAAAICCWFFNMLCLLSFSHPLFFYLFPLFYFVRRSSHCISIQFHFS